MPFLRKEGEIPVSGKFIPYRNEGLIMSVRLVYILFILILCSLPVLANPVTILPGGEVYLGEEGLDIHRAVPYPYTSIAYYTPGSSPGRDQPLDIVRVNQDRFNVIPDLYYDRTGAWYQWDPVQGMPGQVAFIVRNPRISLKVMDRNTMGDRSFGTVSRGTPLVMQVETNLAGITRRPDYSYNDGPVKILIRTPAGGTLAGVKTPGGGEYSFSSFTPTGELNYAPPIESGGWDTGWSGYESGLYTIEPEFSINRMQENLRSFQGGYSIRGTEVTLGSERAGLYVSSETVVRGDPFAVTITGNPGMAYLVWIEGGSKSGSYGDQPPMILTSQEGIRQDNPEGTYYIGSYRPSGKSQSIRDIVPSTPYGGVYYYAEVIPDRNGKRTVEFRTTDATGDRRYTIHVEGPRGATNPKSDDVNVKVEKGSVTLSTGSNSYAIGEEVILHGRNTGSCDTYLFITGPNLPSAGGRLDAPRIPVTQGNPSSFTVAGGDCETWEYRLFTGNLGLDTGTYTIYAVSSPSDRYHLSSTSWQTIPITLTRPYVSVSKQRMSVAKGDELIITGASGGDPDAGVAIWIFGRNYFMYDTVSTERGGWFSYELSRAFTESMEPGEYQVIVQHPMANGNFDLWPDGSREVVLGTTPWYGAPVFRVSGPGSLQGSAAASALISALKSPYIDDTYTEYSIYIQSPKITIEQDTLTGFVDEPIILSGSTNFAPGTRLLVEISDNAFAPTQKGIGVDYYGFSDTITTYTGPDGEQEFSVEIPAGVLPVGRYMVFIQGVANEGTATGWLQVIEKPVETIVPTPLLTEEPMNVTVNVTLVPEITTLETTSIPDTPQVVTQKSPEIPAGLSYAMKEPVVLLAAGIVVGLLIACLVALVMTRRQDKSGDEGIKEEEEEESGEDEGDNSDSGEEIKI
ncbi:hypothetical protein DLD82_04015 [Methanospirillum stamsii]|uniref:DUF3821 domain-containing protein n=2 Tax=Methanospirillum stamsii TaxID=1277351 RepID=A0A2V2NAX8_9EURY|nr:hypothetical protein DLD82_04015 [Methanospirillum stamsii]